MKILSFLLCFTPVVISAQSSAPYWLVGYYAPFEVKSQTPALIPWTKYTHINHFAVFPNKNCTVDTILIRNQISTFVSAAHAAGRNALITLKDRDESPEVFLSCTNSRNISGFVNNIVSFIKSHNYDGLDLDWEQVPLFPGRYISRYTDLISRLRAQMPDKLLTMAVYWNAPGHALEEVAAASQAKLDRVSVMCYDMDGVGKGERVSWYVDALWQAGDVSKSACDAEVDAFVSRGLAAQKVNVGFPFYGRINPSVTQAGVSRTTLFRTSIYYRDLIQNKSLWQEKYQRYDHKHGANYLSIPNSKKFISYGGPEMIDEVVDWVRNRHFGGVMTFTTGYEYLPEKTGDLRYPLTTRIHSRLFADTPPRDSVSVSAILPAQ